MNTPPCITPGIRFRTGKARAASAKPSSRFVSLEIDERRERQAAAAREVARQQSKRVSREKRAAVRREEARAWAISVGFTDRELDYAVMHALTLRAQLGEGQVTAAMVRARMEATVQ